MPTESELITLHAPLARSIVRRLRPPWMEPEDALQEGLIGLLRAIRTFDPARASFGTYATLMIRSEARKAKDFYARSSL